MAEETSREDLGLDVSASAAPNLIDTESLIKAPRIYAQHVQSSVNIEEAMLTFSLRHELSTDDPDRTERYLFPQVVCIISVPHFLRLAAMVHAQALQLQETMNAYVEAKTKGRVIDDVTTDGS